MWKSRAQVAEVTHNLEVAFLFTRLDCLISYVHKQKTLPEKSRKVISSSGETME